MQVSINQQVGYSKPFFQASAKTSTMPDDKKPAATQEPHEAHNSSHNAKQQKSITGYLKNFFKKILTWVENFYHWDTLNAFITSQHSYSSDCLRSAIHFIKGHFT